MKYTYWVYTKGRLFLHLNKHDGTEVWTKSLLKATPFRSPNSALDNEKPKKVTLSISKK